MSSQILLVSLNSLGKCHCRNHRSVADGLKFHMPSAIGPFKFYNDKVGFFIKKQEVDPSGRVFPRTKLFSENHPIFDNNLDLVPQKTLEICTFLEFNLLKRG